MKIKSLSIFWPNKKGFTLIEILVVTAILGILIGISTTVFLGVLRSQNKTTAINEARQNASLVIDLFERDVRSATSITQSGGVLNNVTLVGTPDGNIVWKCVAGAVGPSNSKFTRATVDITNTDTVSGVDIDCNYDGDGDGTGDGAFVIDNPTGSRTVRLAFSVRQGVTAPARNDFNINLPFETTVSTLQF